MSNSIWVSPQYIPILSVMRRDSPPTKLGPGSVLIHGLAIKVGDEGSFASILSIIKVRVMGLKEMVCLSKPNH